jgi:CRISPR-associated protein Cas2
MEEMSVLVFYDIGSDKLRNKVGEKCKDFGLERIQFSGFSGKLDRQKREQLKISLTNILDGKEATLYIQPICSKCLEDALIIAKKKEPSKSLNPDIYFGMKINRLYRDSAEN